MQKGSDTRSNHDETDVLSQDSTANGSEEGSAPMSGAMPPSDMAKPHNQVLLTEPNSRWQDLPPPPSPDLHDISYSNGLITKNGLRIIGARVRGKSHKNAGTNCDDWFEFGIIEKWTAMVVADGVGSRKLSRVGAKVACQATMKKLQDDLAHHVLTRWDSLSHAQEAIKRDKYQRFKDPSIHVVEEALFHAVDTAYHSLEIECKDRAGKREYIDLLGGREPEINDFSTTLLLAVHTCFWVNNSEYDLVFSLQVGDGMIASIRVDNSLKLLGKADSGEYAGQVLPITNKRIRQENELRSRQNGDGGRLKAVMLMTDGVADDYFPNNPQMLNLYKDLEKHGIIASGSAIDVNQASYSALTPEKRLEQWLGSYEVKGSFDDRTLVVLYREGT